MQESCQDCHTHTRTSHAHAHTHTRARGVSRKSRKTFYLIKYYLGFYFIFFKEFCITGAREVHNQKSTSHYYQVNRYILS